MSKEKKTKYLKPVFIRGIVITALIALTLLLPAVISESVSYGEAITVANLFKKDDGLKLIIFIFVDAVLGSSGANLNSSVVTFISYFIYIAVLALIVIAIIDLVFFIIALCTKKYNKFFKVINFITAIVTFLSFLANFIMAALIIFMAIGEMTSSGGAFGQAIKTLLAYGGHMYLIWAILSMWLFCIKCKAGKRQAF